MEKLGIHIVELLNENPEVYLPGIGLFKKERIPASFDETTTSFSAPSHRIILLNHERGSAKLLIESISHDEEITDEESEEQLKKVIGAILLEVNEKGKAEIPGLGNLVKERDALTFIHTQTQKEKLPFYRSVKEIKLISPSPKQEIPSEEVSETTLESSLVEEAPETVEIPQEFAPERRSLNWLWSVLALLAVIGAGAYWYATAPQKASSSVDIAQPLPTDEVPLVDTLQADTLSGSLVQTPVDSLENIGVETALTEQQVPTEKTTFEIIVVSFGKIADAEQYVETMKAKGHQLHVLENRRAGNQIKVSHGSYATEAEAQEALNNVRENFAKEAWVYKKTHTK